MNLPSQTTFITQRSDTTMLRPSTSLHKDGTHSAQNFHGSGHLLFTNLFILLLLCGSLRKERHNVVEVITMWLSQTGSLLEQATEAQSIKSGCFGHVRTQTIVSWKLMTETSWFWLLVLCCKWPHLRKGALFEHGSQSLLYMPCTQPNEWEGLIEVNAKTSYNDNSCTMYAFF